MWRHTPLTPALGRSRWICEILDIIVNSRSTRAPQWDLTTENKNEKIAFWPIHVPVAHTHLHSYLHKIKINNVLKGLDLLRQGVSVCRIRASRVPLLLFCLLVLLPSFPPRSVSWAPTVYHTWSRHRVLQSTEQVLSQLSCSSHSLKVTALCPLIWQFYY